MNGLEFILDLAIVALVAGIAGVICRRLNLSVVVGFLVAGIMIGPYTPPFQLVNDAGRIRMLADLGLLFLIFGIGLGFSLPRLRRLGFPLVAAIALGSLLVLIVCRTASSLLGFSGQQGLFIAGILMVSSSAIIAKVLEEVRANHTRWGQLALGITLMEDIVAIVLLAVLSSMTGLGDEASSSLWETISAFSGFVVLSTVAALMLVPRALRWLEKSGTPELRVLLVAGLLLGMGWGAQRLGYSMALSAFILGAIIGSTPTRPEVDRLFEGMRHLFGAVFFVAMGMLFDVGSLGEFWIPMIGIVVAAIVVRSLAVTVGLVLTGNDPGDAFRAGLSVTPLGEFSFVIAFLGVETGVMPESFYPAALGAALLTGLLSPLLIRRADPLGEAFVSRMPRRIDAGLSAYRQLLVDIQHRQNANVVWRLTASRIWQVLFQILVVAGCLAIAEPAYRLLVSLIGADLLIPNGTVIVFSLAVGLLVLPGLVAVWRNVSAISMIVAEGVTGDHARITRLRPLVQRLIACAAATVALLWLSVLIPAGAIPLTLAVSLLAILVLSTVLLWGRLIHWHSKFEVSLSEELAATEVPSTQEVPQWKPDLFEKKGAEGLRVEEISIPRDARHAGQRIIDLGLRADFSCSIVSIDRQGFAINNPSPQDRLYPGDRVLLLGTHEKIGQAAAFLGDRMRDALWMQQFDELTTEWTIVPTATPMTGKSLRELNLAATYGVQIGAIGRTETGSRSPRADDMLEAGDRLLVVGTHKNIKSFIASLEAASPSRSGDRISVSGVQQDSRI